MREIKLTQGYIALIDDEDYDLVSWFSWHAHVCLKTVYARTAGSILMHRLVMRAPKGMEVAHLDDNGLNNRKQNLMIMTHADHRGLSGHVLYCKRGHLMAGYNLIIQKGNNRVCRECSLIRNRLFKARRLERDIRAAALKHSKDVQT
jgi:hypothetical protein